MTKSRHGRMISFFVCCMGLSLMTFYQQRVKVTAAYPKSVQRSIQLTETAPEQNEEEGLMFWKATETKKDDKSDQKGYPTTASPATASPTSGAPTTSSPSASPTKTPTTASPTTLGPSVAAAGEPSDGDQDSSSQFAFSDQELDTVRANPHNCFPVKDICISADYQVTHKRNHRNRLVTTMHTQSQWFYVDNGHDDTWQPNFILDHRIDKDLVAEPIFQTSSIKATNSQQFQQKCPTSPIPNHFVLFGFYLNMVADFYLRAVVGIYELWKDMPTESNWKTQPNNSHIQFHSYVFKDKIYFMHLPIPSTADLLMAGFTAHKVLNFVDWFKPTPHENATSTSIDSSNYEAGNSSSCQCFSRLIMCSPKPKQMDNGTVHLTPEAQIGRRKKEDMNPPVPFDRVKQHVLEQGAARKFPTLSNAIQEFKREAIQTAMNETLNDVLVLEEWTLIGFSQRNTRRRWLNLPEIIRQCHDQWLRKYKIVCVEVNLDTARARSDQEHQVAMHAGLDALVGIHGSNQVHGLWMPNGSYMLELLPHLFASWGGWTQTTHKRTVNGMFFNHTGINHVGYPLNVSSVPNCSLPEFQHMIPKCNGQQKWDNRDFLAPLQVVDSFVHRFLILNDKTASRRQTTMTVPKMRNCKDYDELAQEEFVLYNVNCIRDDTHHALAYFRPRHSFPHLNTTSVRRRRLRWGADRMAADTTSNAMMLPCTDGCLYA